MIKSNNKIVLILSLFMLLGQFIIAQDKLIFSLVKNGDPQKLSAYLDTTKTSINITNTKGYSPLHVLIENYVAYDVELITKDEKAYDENSDRSEDFWDCMKLLLDKGASTSQLTPEGWNALQYAVLNGKLSPVNYIISKFGGANVRDKEGNTLLHLSLLINPDEVTAQFLKSIAFSFGDIDYTSLNNKGQTPLTFYMSEPRCNWKNAVSKNKQETASNSNQNCISSNTYKMLENFKDFDMKSMLTVDKYGKNAIDYMKVHNTWALSSFQYFVDLASQAHKELEDQRLAYAQVNDKQNEEYTNIEDYNGSCRACEINETFSRKYSYECNFSQYDKTKMVNTKLREEVLIEVRPDKIIVYAPYHIHDCKIISSRFNDEGDLEYEVDDTSYKFIGFVKGLDKVFLIRYDNTVNGYCNF